MSGGYEEYSEIEKDNSVICNECQTNKNPFPKKCPIIEAVKRRRYKNNRILF